MNTDSESILPSEVGDRLRMARERSGITQADAADAIHISRTTLVAIEQGLRRARMGEVRLLARRYGMTVNALVREEAVHVDFTPRFRKLAHGSETAATSAVKLLSDLVKAEVELENLLGIKRAKDLPPERPLLPGDVVAQAEQNAIELRERLGLGSAPIPNIASVLEMDLNIRLYIRKIDSSISGIFAYDEAVGPCILLNAKHRRDRRAQSGAHECGHFISTRRDPEILHADPLETPRSERYAIAFGRAFLTPSRSVMKKYQEVTAGAETLSRRHVIILASYFSVSREAIVRRLEELKLVRSGTWDWFDAHGGITDDHERQVLGDQLIPDLQQLEAQKPTTLRLQSLAAEVYRRELLSESQLAQLLCLDRVELRMLLDEVDAGSLGGEGDEAPKLLD